MSTTAGAIAIARALQMPLDHAVITAMLQALAGS
jgi:hypothetical protein